MNRRCWLFATITLFSLLVGCVSGSRQESVSLDEIRIVYSREGGIAGIKQEWIIHPDGLIEGPGEEEFLAPPEDVVAILESGAASGVEEFAAMETSPDSCCDQFTYTLTFEVGGEKWNLVMSDDSEQPQEVSELLAMVEKLIAEAEPTS
jgi:hypothetical protein